MFNDTPAQKTLNKIQNLLKKKTFRVKLKIFHHTTAEKTLHVYDEDDGIGFSDSKMMIVVIEMVMVVMMA